MLCDLGCNEGVPFSHDDIFAGRRMYDMTHRLFLEIVKYDLNQRGPLPKAAEVAKKILLVKGDDHLNLNFIHYLS